MLLRAHSDRHIPATRRSGGTFDMVKATVWLSVATLPWIMLAWVGRVL